MESISKELLISLVDRADGGPARTAEIIRLSLEEAGLADETALKYLSTDAHDHLRSPVVDQVYSTLQALVVRGVLEGEGNWGTPPAHPQHTSVRRPTK